MARLRVGQDEIRFAEAHREAARTVAELLPEVRARAAELAGLTAPSVRVVLTASPPCAYDFFRFGPTGGLAAAIAASALVGMAWAMEVPWWVALLTVVLVAAAHGYPWYNWYRGTRRWWEVAGGLTVPPYVILAPVIVVRWAPTPDRVGEALMFPMASPEEWLRFALAHEYAHVALHAHYRALGLPAWWDEGFAFWFAQQALERQVWRPESEACRGEQEPEGDARWMLDKEHQEAYLRLCARWYWEAREVVEAGRLGQLLGAPAARLNALRPAMPADQTVPRT